MAKQQLWPIMAVAVIIFSGTFLPAQEEDPPKVSKKPAIPKKQDQPPVLPKADKPADPLERVIVSMRAAHDRIANTKLDRETQDLQKTIIQDLDQLIELAKQKQPGNNKAQPRQQAKPQPSPPQETDQKRQSSSQPGNNDPSRTNPGETTEQIRKDKKKEVQRLREQRLVNEVWGHLPDRLRKRLRKDYSGQYLKRYEELVRRYFQALAEEGRKTKRRRSSFRE